MANLLRIVFSWTDITNKLKICCMCGDWGLHVLKTHSVGFLTNSTNTSLIVIGSLVGDWEIADKGMTTVPLKGPLPPEFFFLKTPELFHIGLCWSVSLLPPNSCVEVLPDEVTRVRLNPICLSSLWRGDIWTQTHTWGRSRDRKAEFGMMYLQAKECQRLPATTWSCDKGKGQILPQSPKGPDPSTVNSWQCVWTR